MHVLSLRDPSDGREYRLFSASPPPHHDELITHFSAWIIRDDGLFSQQRLNISSPQAHLSNAEEEQSKNSPTLQNNIDLPSSPTTRTSVHANHAPTVHQYFIFLPALPNMADKLTNNTAFLHLAHVLHLVETCAQLTNIDSLARGA